jgi:hypothetical protein
VLGEPRSSKVQAQDHGPRGAGSSRTQRVGWPAALTSPWRANSAKVAVAALVTITSSKAVQQAARMTGRWRQSIAQVRREPALWRLLATICRRACA